MKKRNHWKLMLQLSGLVKPLRGIYGSGCAYGTGRTFVCDFYYSVCGICPAGRTG